MSALMPCSLASAAFACELQSCNSREIVASSAPDLTQLTVVGFCPVQTVSSRHPSAAATGGRCARSSGALLGKCPVESALIEPNQYGPLFRRPRVVPASNLGSAAQASP